MLRVRLILVILSLLTPLTGCDVSKYWSPPDSVAEGNSPEVLSPRINRVIAQGRIEPANGVISVFATPGDRVEAYSGGVVEGARVEKGEGLGELASLITRRLEIQALKATLSETQAMRAATLAAKESDLAAAESAIKQVAAAGDELAAKKKEVESLAIQLDLVVAESRRLVRLRKNSDLVSASKIQKAKVAAEQAKAALDAAKIQYEALAGSAKANLDAAISKKDSVAAGHDRALAAIPFDSTSVKIQLLEEQLRNATIPSPSSGTILKIHTPPGDTIGRKPLLQLADLGTMVCVAEVYEAYLKDLRVGQHATLRSSAFDGGVEVTGKIRSIGRMISGGELKELDPFSKSDVRVVEAVIAIDPGKSTEQAAKVVHLQVEVEIVIRDAADE